VIGKNSAAVPKLKLYFVLVTLAPLTLEMCQGCHNMGMRGGMGMGMSQGETAPKLGGQHAAYLEKVLRAYSTGERRHYVMSRMAAMLSDRDITDIARRNN
jgi:cytochrome c553